MVTITLFHQKLQQHNENSNFSHKETAVAVVCTENRGNKILSSTVVANFCKVSVIKTTKISELSDFHLF